jgi:hypothetical protein
MNDLGHWVINESVYTPENFFGFIYRIENKITGKYYIGKKQCLRKIKKKPLKGRINKRISISESDWKTYTGSSNDLNEDIKKYGKENFVFLILKICGSKWELAYEEIKEQLSKDVLKDELSYNGIMNVRIGRPPRSLLIKEDTL